MLNNSLLAITFAVASGAVRAAEIRIPMPGNESLVFTAPDDWRVQNATARAAEAVRPIPPGEPIAGVSQLDWSQRWWQWAFSFERARSPVADRTGERCGSRQSGDVWFLAGTYGTDRVERTCRVPRGKTLFFPLINYMMYRPQGSNRRCSDLIKQAAEATDEPLALVLDIDGQQFTALAPHRLKTADCFSLVPGEPADAAANGYYVALPPLSPGEHVLNFGGLLPSFTQAVTYRLIVD